jgi:hypothetical protein
VTDPLICHASRSADQPPRRPPLDRAAEAGVHDAFGRSPIAGPHRAGAERGRSSSPLRGWLAGAAAAAVFGLGSFLVVRASFDHAPTTNPFAGNGSAQGGPGGNGGGGPAGPGGEGFPPGSGPGPFQP